jgi:hypothetical protein
MPARVVSKRYARWVDPRPHGHGRQDEDDPEEHNEEAAGMPAYKPPGSVNRCHLA